MIRNTVLEIHYFISSSLRHTLHIFTFVYNFTPW